MSGHSNTKPEKFARYVAIGLAWGAFGAIALMCAALLAEASSRTQPTNDAFYLLIAAGTVVVATLAAVVTAPFAAFFAWPLYRDGVRAHAPYALAGAVASLPLPIVFQLPNGAIFDPDRINVASLAWFVVSGAFGGFMAARALMRETRDR